jgi:protein involved in polysaccharide export with SLBB domain
MRAQAVPSGDKMSNYLIARIPSKNGLLAGSLSVRPACLAAAAILGLVLCLIASGCGTAALPQIPPPAGETNAASLSLHEGDVLQIKFPGAPEMDAVQTIRADGRITILNASDVRVSGLTPDEAAQAILAAVGSQLKVKQVSVTVQTSSFIVYVTGAVLRPGKLVSDRPLTVFQAVIEAGIDSTKSRLEKVKVIRTDATGHNAYKILDLNKIIQGEWQAEPFTLKPYDTIVVPEKFTFF